MMELLHALLVMLLLAATSSCSTWSRVDFVDLVTAGRDGWQHPERVVDVLALAPGDTVAEIGAGDGYWLRHLSREVGPAGRVYAVEVEPDLVAELEALVVEDGLQNVTVVRGGYEDPKLPDGSIDLALTCLTYHHIEGRPEYFRRLRGDLSERGRVAHLDDRPDVPAPFGWFLNEGHWSDPAAVHREMAEAGYRRVAEYDFLPMQSFQVFEPSGAATSAPR